jgi:hypothetical protein
MQLPVYGVQWWDLVLLMWKPRAVLFAESGISWHVTVHILLCKCRQLLVCIIGVRYRKLIAGTL